MKKKFPTEDVLTMATGKLLGSMEGLYEIQSYLVGYSVMTHEFPDLMPKSGLWVREQHPKLKKVEVPEGLTTEQLLSWVEEMKKKFGKELEIQPLSEAMP